MVIRLRLPRPPAVGRAWRESRRRLAGGLSAVRRRAGAGLGTPTAQLLAAVGAALLGGALIGRWCVGLLLITGAALVAADALLRESGALTERAAASSHEDVLDRWRRAR